ncbi:ATP-grasp domain-containing protein [Micromonospora profundi]|uniref:ATP-grasp domain-containing protein n=1 Tax=Micromonospora profundi TaxID=1420889 RepID=UPI002FEE6B67
MACAKEFVSSPADVDLVLRTYQNAVFWPLNYTIDPGMNGPLIVDILTRSRRPYITCDPLGARYTSKLRFKQALRESGFPTPDWRIAHEGWRSVAPDLSYPLFLKSEFSCDSAGVRRIEEATQLHEEYRRLSAELDETLFIEAVAGKSEVTVACIASRHGLLTAAMNMAAKNAPYIDEYAKHHNEALILMPAAPRTQLMLHQHVAKMANQLRLNGYFRIDFLLDTDGTPKAIDMNILPCLNANPDQLSYLPMAFMQANNCSFRDVIGAILDSMQPFDVYPTRFSSLQALMSSSKLLIHREGPAPW